MMKKRLLCIAAAVLMVLAAVFAFGCEKQFPSEQEVLKSHLDKYCRENGEKIIEKYKNYFSGAQCSACYVDDSALVIEFRLTRKYPILNFSRGLLRIRKTSLPSFGRSLRRLPMHRKSHIQALS